MGLQSAYAGGEAAGLYLYAQSTLPGEPDVTRLLLRADRWFAGLRAEGKRSVRAHEPPPFPVTVDLSDEHPKKQAGRAVAEVGWPEGDAAMRWDRRNVVSAEVAAEVMGQRLLRVLEFPANMTIAPSSAPTQEAHRRAFLERIADSDSGGGRLAVTAVLARHVLGRPDAERDAATLTETLDWIDGRPDCADFPLATVVRLNAVGWGTDGQRQRMRRTMLAFRYWDDEPGCDAMCFGSENHSLLFHGSQYVAGLLLPDETFTNSGRSGREQAAIGRQRCRAWLAWRERFGFLEFLSRTYYPLTMGALMNLVDLADDEGLSRRAAALVDVMYRQLAEHSFDGVTVAPQGRVYRGIVTPHTSGAQGMLSYGERRAVSADCSWAVLVAASPTYRPPGDLGDLMGRPVRKSCRQSYVRVRLCKTPHYMLSSVAIPCVYADDGGAGGLRQGESGYQQHLWHAALGRDCHVFVNHPGASFDPSSARPGFWYGNGFLPRLAQDGPAVTAIYSIPDSHPMQFTHAHWPTDAFDRCEMRDGWHFAARGDGYVGLWCSRPTSLETGVLTDRELRADGARVAWHCVCSHGGQAGGFEAFVESCRRAAMRFDPETLTVSRDGEVLLRWDAPQEAGDDGGSEETA